MVLEAHQIRAMGRLTFIRPKRLQVRKASYKPENQPFLQHVTKSDMALLLRMQNSGSRNTFIGSLSTVVTNVVNSQVFQHVSGTDDTEFRGREEAKY